MRQDVDVDRDIDTSKDRDRARRQMLESCKSRHDSEIDVNMNIHDKSFKKMLKEKGSSALGFTEYPLKECALLHSPG